MNEGSSVNLNRTLIQKRNESVWGRDDNCKQWNELRFSTTMKTTNNIHKTILKKQKKNERNKL